MSSDRTQHQSFEDQKKARELSLEPVRAPAEVPGYRIRHFLGRGTYGEVWLATDLKTGRKVAIKFYLGGSNQDIKLLAQEVEKLVVLSADRYVVQLFDVGWEADPPYYVMEYIEHGSLEDVLKDGKGIATPEAIDLFQELATGLMHLHGKGILHCDLKPGNVLLDQGGKPRVADFGQSRLKTEKSPALGTLFYMAPEQADTSAIPDTGWDVYALGALLYCMLTGAPPYYSQELAKKIENTEEIGARLEAYREALFESPLPKNHRSVTGVDRALADIVDRCIAADPKKRFTSIQSVLLALRQRELIKTRRPIMLLGLIGPLLLIGLGGIFGWWAFNQAISRTNAAVTDKARNSNEFAAELAARSVAEQIDEYFRVVTHLAKDPSFLAKFDAAIGDPSLEGLRIKLADVQKNAVRGVEDNEQIAALREQFKNNPYRLALQPFLQERLDNRDHDYPVADSWFVSDRFGNQLASVFPEENITLGSNFAYRTYFTGRAQDLKFEEIQYQPDKNVLNSRLIIQQPHLSAVFQSEQSKTWKIAFSAPIFRKGNVAGIVAVTVDLGNFVDFSHSTDQYAMLVDGRQSVGLRGRILEHPVFEDVIERINEQSGLEKLPDDLAQMIVDVEKVNSEVIFEDPVGRSEVGKKLGFGSPSIAKSVDVTMENAGRIENFDGRNVPPSSIRQPTGLKVIAVQNYDTVLSDVRDLGQQLSRLGLLATVLLAAVAIGMWIFVNGLMRETRDRLARSFSPTDSSWLNLETTEWSDKKVKRGRPTFSRSRGETQQDEK